MLSACGTIVWQPEALDHWHRCDDTAGHFCDELPRPSKRGWQCAEFAGVLNIWVETVREVNRDSIAGGVSIGG